MVDSQGTKVKVKSKVTTLKAQLLDVKFIPAEHETFWVQSKGTISQKRKGEENLSEGHGIKVKDRPKVTVPKGTSTRDDIDPCRL